MTNLPLDGLRLSIGLRAINAANAAPSAYLDIARAAESQGFGGLWTSEIRATDPFSLLGWVGSHTSRIGLGCAVAQVTARSAIASAAGMVTLNGLSGGRFRLGLGVSGPQIVQGWHGRSFDRPLSYMREYVAVVRTALSGEPLSFSGKEITLPAYGPEAVPPLAFPVPPSRLPVHLSGLGPRAVALAGEIADGWIAIHCPPAYMEQARSWLKQGANVAGRSLGNFSTSVMLICSVDEDQDLAWDLSRPTVAMFVGGMGTRRTNFYNQLATRLGFGRAATAVREAYQVGDIDRAIAAVDDELVDALTLSGPLAKVGERLGEYRRAGVDEVILGLTAPSHRAQLRQIEEIAQLAEGGSRACD
jgi:F420-dependent oxidoreductase-like protein